MWQEQDPLVTLQLGLIGKDGWVIASDRKQVEETGPIRSSNETIKVIANQHLASAASGDGLALIANAEIVNWTFERSNIRQELSLFGNYVWDKYHAMLDPPFSESYRRGLLVGFSDPRKIIWVLNIGKSTSHATPCPGKVIAGDTRNPATFLTEYYSASSTLTELSFLAAHIITVGSMLNTAGVGGGLDIIICDNGNIRMLDSSEIQDIEERSRDTDRQIDRLFRG